MMKNPERPALVKILLQGHCDPNIPTVDTRETALHLAAKFGCLETVKMLLEYGADYEMYDKYGRNALIVALQEGQEDIAELFVRLGKKLNPKELYNDKYLAFVKEIYPKDFSGWFTEEMLKMPSLKCLSRDRIRHHLMTQEETYPLANDQRFDFRVTHLPLPQRLKDFVFMTVGP